MLYLFTFLLGSVMVLNAKAEDYSKTVDPFIGTGGHGHTYPGATAPFGMVQLSPDTRGENWDGSSGYHYSDSTIMGFSHTHLSGTGAPEFCDVLFMPTVGEVQWLPGDERDSKSGYRSAFRHENEKATPGYYRVLLDDDHILAELTATTRTGFHRYMFPKAERANVIIDLQHRDKVVESGIQIMSDSEIAGFRRSTGWASDQYIYFVARFSKPFKTFGIAVNDTLVDAIRQAEGKDVKAFVRWQTKAGEQILVKVGISAVDIDGARKNLAAENSGWDFGGVKKQAENAWNRYLSKIEINGGTKKERRIFYTALYHTALAPTIFMDTDGPYRGVDHKVHRAEGFTNYTIFSLWDVFRAHMPLMTILEPSRMHDFILTFLDMYRLAGRLPRWEIAGNLSGVMIGNHALPVILDAWNKGIRDFDANLAFHGMKGAMENIEFYNNLGYIPADIEGRGGSVSMVVEYAYNDWCVAEMAKNLGKRDDRLLYQQRAQFYRNVFDSTSGYMRPRNFDHSWVTPFDPAENSGHYVEGNAFQYSPFVPQDVQGLIDLLGGDEKFVAWLDTLFTLHSQYDKNVVDAGGLIGQYAHGNEPSHQIAYLYNYAGAPWKTQKQVRQILAELYDDKPDGLSGNEDCGQISAWYVLSAMGFYPVTPGEPIYAVGSPIFDSATIHLENGEKFVIRAKNVSAQKQYIQSATLNGEPYTKSWFHHQQILDGGEFVFEMGAMPNEQWGEAKSDRPPAHTFVPATAIPYYTVKENYFFDKATVSLHCDTPGAEIYYTLDGSEPTRESRLYTCPFELHQTTELKMIAFKDGLLPSGVTTRKIEKLASVEWADFKNYQGGDLAPGLQFEYFEVNVLSVSELDKYEPKATGVISNFNITERPHSVAFAYIYRGYIKIPRDGVYTFYVESNDGSILYLDGREFINIDGPHTAFPVSKTIGLKAGVYRIEQKYFQMGGGLFNRVTWKGPGIKKQEIPGEVLFH